MELLPPNFKLLADDITSVQALFDWAIEADNVLSAILELHSEDEGQCAHCCIAENDDYASGIAIPSPYPCPTVQQITPTREETK